MIREVESDGCTGSTGNMVEIEIPPPPTREAPRPEDTVAENLSAEEENTLKYACRVYDELQFILMSRLIPSFTDLPKSS